MFDYIIYVVINNISFAFHPTIINITLCFRYLIGIEMRPLFVEIPVK